jgi:hypothetical protein
VSSGPVSCAGQLVHLAFAVVIPLACTKRPSPKWLLHAGDPVTVLCGAQGQSALVPQTTSLVCGVSPSARAPSTGPSSISLASLRMEGLSLFGCVLAKQCSS